MRHSRPALGVLFATSLVVAGCGTDNGDGEEAAQETPSGGVAIATTTMLGDVVSDIMACAGGTSETLMPVGADPHDFSASSDQVARLIGADLVVANGLALEEGLTDTLSSAESDGANVVEVAPLVDPIEFDAGGHSHGDEHSHDEEKAEGEEHSHEEGDEHSHDEEKAEGEEHSHDEEKAEGEEHSHDEGEEHSHEESEEHSDEEGEEHSHEEGEEHDHAHDHGSMDPHFWHDAARMAEAAELVGAELAETTGNEVYTECGVQVHDELMETDEQVRETLSAIPDDQRVLVTDHDAFGYFAEAYDFEVVGVVIPGGSTLAEPSSAELAELVETVENEAVPAIFANTATTSALVEAVANETGTDVEVVELYVGSLGGPDSGADTYTGMATTNAQRIADALS